MNCTSCGKPLSPKTDTSYNTKQDNKPYVRDLYNCPDCDVWIKVETPKVTETVAK